MNDYNEANRRTALRAFLRERRARISPRDAGLPVRPGRRIAGLSAENVAELIGVSTRWYQHFEAGRIDRRFSRQFLERVALALQLDEEARITLYRLALHQVDAAVAYLERRTSSSSLTGQAREILDAFGSFRRLTRRLWAATTETEALTCVSEAIADHLGDPDFIGSYTKVAPGAWQFPTVIATDHLQQRIGSAFGNIWGSVTPEQVDEVMLDRLLIEPGQVAVKSELFNQQYRFASLVNGGFDSVGLPNTEFVVTHVRSRQGFEANLFAAFMMVGPRTVSAVELAQMSTLGELTSVAIS